MKKNLLYFLFVLILFSACNNSGNVSEQNYTVPSWTLYQRALHSGKTAEEAKKLLILKDFPYNVNTTINGDPMTQMGVAWFTNANVTGGVVQIVEGKVDNVSAFDGAREIPAVTEAIDSINYVSTGNNNKNNNEGLIRATGFVKGEKRSYTGNKALIDNLKPNTVYSYRVGKKGAWSEIGSFTTAKDNKDAFEFLYVTDPQANTDEMFDISKRTVETAYSQTPDAKFILIAGDFIESAKEQSSEWEWEQWFEKLQNVWLHLPVVPVQGNHDASPFGNFFHHFNTDNTYNEQQTDDITKTTMGGTVYSFVYGDALFMVINYEDYQKGEFYFASIERWLRKQVADHKDVKWKIVAYHKAMFTGSNSHQTEEETESTKEQDGRIVRERFASVFQDLKIDLAIQGHDHIYEVIGVVAANGKNFTHLANAVSNQTTVTPTFTNGETVSPDVTGKRGGTYDVSNGVLYFLNNSAGKKKYYPRSKEQMEAAYRQHGVKDYFDLFNKFGQTGEPTFSHIKVSTDSIDVTTYTVDNNGEVKQFDAFKIVKK